MASNRPRFDLHDLPSAYFCDNIKANSLRTELIKNQVRISECEQGDLENVFFSDENISLINKQLILSVYRKSKGQIVISEQSKQSLIIVMRYVYLEHARHLPYDISGQIRELNCRVVGEILPLVITNATQRIDYLKEIESPFSLIPLPENVHKGKKNINSITSLM